MASPERLAVLRDWARRLKREVLALWVAARDRRTPWSARLVAGFAAAYALSPIDLIPDFIPVLGLLDDVILLPGLIWLAIRLVPPSLMEEFRRQADRMPAPVSRTAKWIIILLWLLGLAFVIRWLHEHLSAGWLSA
ncbi:MAG: YkvA family protein [Beijerinckiaceae bacterium]|nr:YkvA family protein [Beijerinckiaceae bacterium]